MKKATKRTPKTIVLDTSVLIHDTNSINNFEENYVVIPLAVINELDGLKKGNNNIAHSARAVLRNINKLRDNGNLAKGVPLENGGMVYVVDDKGLTGKPDDQIVETAVKISSNGSIFPKPVVVVSKDAGVCIKADATGKVKGEDYRYDQVSTYQQYGNILNEEKHSNSIKSVQYVYSPVSDNIYRVCADGSKKAIKKGRVVFESITAKNIEQECAIDALFNPENNIIAFQGPAGCGKTLLSLAAGLQQVTKNDPLYDQVIVIRPIVPTGNDLGYMPGDKESKVGYWMDSVFDSLEFLFKSQKSYKKDNRNVTTYKPYQYLIDTGLLYLEAMTHIRGRSLARRFIILDDWQNARPIDTKTVVTRCGTGSKIVVCADVGQIDSPFLSEMSNGFVHLVDRFIDETNFSYIKYKDSVRSSLAEQGARLL